MTEIDNKELARRLRQNVLEDLDLWSLKNKQLEYQVNGPGADVSSELFKQWKNLYCPESIHFNLAFDEKEQKILADFDILLNHICDKTQTYLPIITDFVKTNDWIVLNQAAISTLKRIKTISVSKS
ncbi:MAG: hypothetical protein HOK35_19075 [Cytophagia bacterium]|jgi:hypothetical protein|nr:hypothetical protein [Cytophagia bacterium]